MASKNMPVNWDAGLWQQTPATRQEVVTDPERLLAKVRRYRDQTGHDPSIREVLRTGDSSTQRARMTLNTTSTQRGHSSRTDRSKSCSELRHSDCAVGDPELTGIDEKKPWDSTLIIDSVTNPKRPPALRTYFPGAPPVPLVFSLAHNIFLKERVVKQDPTAFFDASVETGNTSSIDDTGVGRKVGEEVGEGPEDVSIHSLNRSLTGRSRRRGPPQPWNPSFYVVPSRNNEAAPSSKRVFFDSMRSETETRQKSAAITLLRTVTNTATSPSTSPSSSPSPHRSRSGGRSRQSSSQERGDEAPLLECLTYTEDDIPVKSSHGVAEAEAERVRRRRRQAGLDDTINKYRSSASDPDFPRYQSGYNPIIQRLDSQRSPRPSLTRGTPSPTREGGERGERGERQGSRGSRSGTSPGMTSMTKLTAPQQEKIKQLVLRETGWCASTGLGPDAMSDPSSSSSSSSTPYVSSYTTAQLRGRYARIGGLAKEDIVPPEMKRAILEPHKADVEIGAMLDMKLVPALAKADADADPRRWKMSDGGHAALKTVRRGSGGSEQEEEEARRRRRSAGWDPGHQALRSTVNDRLHAAQRDLFSSPQPLGGEYTHLGRLSVELTDAKTKRASSSLPMPDGGERERQAAQSAKITRHSTVRLASANASEQAKRRGKGRREREREEAAWHEAIVAARSMGATVTPGDDPLVGKTVSASMPGGVGIKGGPPAEVIKTQANAREAFDVLSYLEGPHALYRSVKAAAAFTSVDDSVGENGLVEVEPTVLGAKMGGFVPPKRGGEGSISKKAINKYMLRDYLEEGKAGAGYAGRIKGKDDEAGIVVKDGRLVKGGEKEKIKGRLDKAVKRQREQGWNMHHQLSRGVTNLSVHMSKRDLFGKPSAATDIDMAVGALDSMDPDMRKIEYRGAVLKDLWERYNGLLKSEAE